jgi:hypothetical protein
VPLGLRTGEVYGIARRQLHRESLRLVIDQAVQRGTKTRASRLAPRKNEEAYGLDITADIVQAVDWHLEQCSGGPEFLFSKTGAFPRYIDSHVRPVRLVRKKFGLRMLSHHKVGRHSVASQAVTSGTRHLSQITKVKIPVLPGFLSSCAGAILPLDNWLHGAD